MQNFSLVLTYFPHLLNTGNSENFFLIGKEQEAQITSQLVMSTEEYFWSPKYYLSVFPYLHFLFIE